MADKFEGWERFPNGDIRVNPVAGWDSFVPFGMACGLRVHYVTSDAALLSGARDYLPLVLTPAQARQLSADLLKSADRAEQRSGTVDS